MHCPACQRAITETTAECECGFSLATLDKRFGIPPSLKSAVTDMLNELSNGDIRRITAEIDRLERRFPQCQFAVVLCCPPDGAPLPLYVFWLFNRGGLSSAVDKGGMNRLVLIAIDPHNSDSAIMIGYGLEPFLPKHRLTSALNAAFTDLASDRIEKGIGACLLELEQQLAEAAKAWPVHFGIGSLEYESMAQLEDSESMQAAY